MKAISVDFYRSNDEALIVKSYLICSVNANLFDSGESTQGISRLTPYMLLVPTNINIVAPALDPPGSVWTAVTSQCSKCFRHALSLLCHA